MTSGISINIKIGDKRYPSDTGYYEDFRDGQIVDIRTMGYYDKCLSARQAQCIIDVPTIDFDTLRGTSDWKSDYYKVYDNWKKYLSVAENGKYVWDFDYIRPDERLRLRDWFIDFKGLLDSSIITQDIYDAIYDKGRKHTKIVYNADVFQLFKHEDADTRLISGIKNDAATSGSFTVGAAGHATDFNDAVSNHIGTPLTGDLTVNHLNEETAISTVAIFNTDTSTNLLKVTADSGAEHTGGAYGNGARVNYGTADWIEFDESTSNTLDNIEISNLALDASGTSNTGIDFRDGSVGGSWLCNRMLVKGDGNTLNGLFSIGSAVPTLHTRNSIVYGLSGGNGIRINTSATTTRTLYNNTAIGCSVGILQNEGTNAGTLTVTNNLSYDNTTDWSDTGAGWGAAPLTNIDKDGTGPQATSTTLDEADPGSDFIDFGNDDYRLKSGANEATLDNGTDLSGTFTDDIQGADRRPAGTWYIGASAIVAAGGLSIPVAMHHRKQMRRRR